MAVQYRDTPTRRIAVGRGAEGPYVDYWRGLRVSALVGVWPLSALFLSFLASAYGGSITGAAWCARATYPGSTPILAVRAMSLQPVWPSTTFGGKVLGKPIDVIAADHQSKADIGAAIARQWFGADNEAGSDRVQARLTRPVLASCAQTPKRSNQSSKPGKRHALG